LGVKTALLLPTVVYGEGEEPIKTTSMTFPWLEQAIVKRGKDLQLERARIRGAEFT
jgi:hypothetical protein